VASWNLEQRGQLVKIEMPRISSGNWIDYMEMGSISMSLLASQNKPTFSKFFLLDLRKKWRVPVRVQQLTAPPLNCYTCLGESLPVVG
jgi:hypothetical protein